MPTAATQLTITVNGETKTFALPMTVEALIQQLGMGGRAVAVEVNRELVPRKAHAATLLKEGDQLEIVTLVGGG
ncbi:MAG: sulfur carrier protein ThiS [Phycisphaerales bacterium]|nr:sulfur carrier protein ThiS [Phycisphaerales bacterium]